MNRKLLTALMTITQLLLLILLAAPAQAADHGVISGAVYHDANANAQPEPGEVNIASATVYVQRAGDATPIMVSADADGYFVVANLPYGAYQVWAEDAYHHLSPVQVVELNEVTGASSVELPIVYDLSNDIELTEITSIYLPMVNR
ncbi:MAG TPA: hypothetical protein DCL15_16690 [Chloroflexi bacterium]|nr:hypothetical protein [Chloroflexota bacterium]HHW89170.1 hypothetical protein [Chloroflexota bacterium]